MKLYVWFVSISSVIMMASCQQQTQVAGNASPYKSLKQIFQHEIASLQKADLVLKEEAELNGQKDGNMQARRSSDTALLQYLFKPFMDADITKPSLAGQYSVNTIANEFTGDTTFIYLAKGNQTRPKEIILNVDKSGLLVSARISSTIKNLIYEHNQNLEYDKQKVARIYTTQKVMLLKPTEMQVTVRFEGGK
ncbi:hypothetical protein LX64_02782 [Chitinophaga skermanii]|uniref:Lipoprotein n=1 Tax=Chitinophaga skermanii TaxID=331697 RepID=A0A327QIT7_9BACT|nr:hypothetical protein [Chitinophaga skermanii]RAJ03905.1 hypothetical protein LX64_02782 [Chitinophaga skermanii]